MGQREKGMIVGQREEGMVVGQREEGMIVGQREEGMVVGQRRAQQQQCEHTNHLQCHHKQETAHINDENPPLIGLN